MGGLLTLPSWTNTFPEIDTTGVDGASSTSVLQGAAIGLYEIGCFAGAIFCLFYGDRYGRRPIIWIGTVIMIVGAVIQTASYDLTQLIIARIITGVGNGMHTSTIPMWQSECSPPHKRGMLIMIEGEQRSLPSEKSPERVTDSLVSILFAAPSQVPSSPVAFACPTGSTLHSTGSTLPLDLLQEPTTSPTSPTPMPLGESQ